jgi:hypothetical protein
MADPLAPSVLFEHVEDSTAFHFPRDWGLPHHGHIELPQPFKLDTPLIQMNTGNALIDDTIKPMDLTFTKFMFLELVIALIIIVLFVSLAARIKGGGRPKGRLWNLLEVFLLYIRDNVARPCIGDHDADRFVPFLWTLFFFVLGCNLMGMIPWMGSPTGALATTAALAFLTFAVVVGSGMKQLGVVGCDWLDSANFRDRNSRLVYQARCACHSSFGEHDGRPCRAFGGHGVYRRKCRCRRRDLGRRDRGQRAGRHGVELT